MEPSGCAQKKIIQFNIDRKKHTQMTFTQWSKVEGGRFLPVENLLPFLSDKVVAERVGSVSWIVPSQHDKALSN